MPPETNTPGEHIPSGEERRRYVRVRPEAQVSIRLVGVPSPEQALSLRNIGTGGLMLVLPKPLPAGTRIQMRIVVKSLNIEFTTGGRVVWTEKNEVAGLSYVGVCFVGLEPGQRQNVLSLIGLHHEDQDSLERRHFIRLSKRIAVEYAPHRKLFKRKHLASTKDISPTGTAILAEKSLSRGTLIDMSIHLEDAQAKPLKIQGVVRDCVKTRGKGALRAMHVQFLNPSKQASDRIASYISRILAAAPIDDITQPAIHREEQEHPQ